MAKYTTGQLARALVIQRKIESFQTKIERLKDKVDSLLGGAMSPVLNGTRGGRRKISAAGRARIAAAQRARWAKLKGRSGKTKAKTGRRKFSAAARAKIALAAKARWAKAKAAGKNRL